LPTPTLKLLHPEILVPQLAWDALVADRVDGADGEVAPKPFKPERQLSGLDRGQRKSAIFHELKSAGPEAPWRRKWPTNQLPKTG
jgi:hypothetical protein